MRKSYKKSIAPDEAEGYRELDVKAADTEYLCLFSSSAPSAPSAVKKIQNNHKSYKMSPLDQESAAPDEDLM